MPEAPTMQEVSAPPAPPAEPPKTKAQREAEAQVLPSLFGAGYGTYRTRPTSFLYSYGFIIAVAAVFILIAGMVKTIPALIEEHPTEVYLPSPPPMVGPNGGGGAHDKTPASKGELPTQSRKTPLTPPTVTRVEEPKLPEAPTIIGPPKTMPMLVQLGDPLGKIGGPSNGSGGGGGIGDGYGGGVGNGRGAYRVGGGVSAPVATYQPDPEYSEEARKAKYQGEVWLMVIVGTDGRAHDIRVSRSLGLGLDEKAMESVRTWKFDPGKKDGVPVAVQITVEVAFHLL